MNRNILVTIIIVIIIFAAGGYLFLNQPKTTSVNPETQTASIAPEATTTTEKATLKSFMTMTGTKQCTFTDTDTDNGGTVYIDAGKVRGDFSSMMNGKTTGTHMINNGAEMYVWMDDQATGFKTSLEAVEQTSGMTGSTQAVDVNKQVDYKCEDWSADPSKFTVPTNIKFNDMTKMMQDTSKMMKSSSLPTASVAVMDSQSCASCDNLDGQAKEMCKSALKCP